MIRSTKHSLKFANAGKLRELSLFLDEYERVGQLLIDQIWEHGYENFSVRKDALELPLYLDYKKFNIKTSLSARALSSLLTQVSGKIRAATKQRAKTVFVRNKLRKAGQPYLHLNKKLAQMRLCKPKFGKGAELSSKCCDIRQSKSGWFLRVKSTGFKTVKIPVRAHKRSNFWLARGELMGSFLISKTATILRYDVPTQKTSGTQKIAIDQGVKTIATLSNGQTTPETCKHGHSFDSICDKLARKRKGSKQFKKAQAHRKNHINWSLNQIAWDTFAEVRLEKIYNIGFRKRRSRKLKHFTNTLIRDKIQRCCEEREVPVVEQDSSYRSQRCSQCGIVRKANRKGKVYSCKHCGMVCDADFNAAQNHAIDLPDATWALRGQKLNLGNGFYWRPDGLFTFGGQELRVPDSARKPIP